MAFSFFGKKPSSTSKSDPRKQGSAAPLRREAPSPPGQADRKPEREELPSLDFTGSASILDGFSSASAIGVDEGTPGAAPAIEEAAMLHANGQTEAACATLAQAVKSEDLGVNAGLAWGMLFDLYQSLGRQEAFETLAMEFAARFETSPPTWVPPQKELADPALITGGRAYVSLSGTLNAQAAEPLKQLMRVAQSNPVVRLELAKLRDADDSGCTLLFKALNALKKAKKEYVLGGAEELAAIIAKKLEPGRREHESMWLLLLDLYQQLFLHEAFEEAAVNYAITFEVSPPSWEAPKTRPQVPSLVEPDHHDSGDVLKGEILAAGPDTFSNLAASVGEKPELVIDALRLTRIDFVSAGQLLNALVRLQSSGKRIRIRGVSRPVAALFDMMGIDRVADIELRKA